MSSAPRIIDSEWTSNPQQLPTHADFDPRKNDNEEREAWEHFGGLSRQEAFTRFSEAPGYYQEDFMFMGATAFAYYFPVIERYILESSLDSDQDSEVDAIWILAHCVISQVEDESNQLTSVDQDRLGLLARFVCENVGRFCTDVERQMEIVSAWRDLESHLADV